jgi:hypothetical protein
MPFLNHVQDRVPGESFAAKPSKDAEMEKIMRSMEVDILAEIYVTSYKYIYEDSNLKVHY